MTGRNFPPGLVPGISLTQIRRGADSPLISFLLLPLLAVKYLPLILEPLYTLTSLVVQAALPEGVLLEFFWAACRTYLSVVRRTH